MLNLRIPGPTPVPADILDAMSRPMINHRGPEYKEMLFSATDRLKQVLETKNDVFILTSSGTGALETAIVNTLSPGDKVLGATIGFFGDRFADIAQTYGADVIRLQSPLGTAVDANELRKALQNEPAIKAVLVTHNESSTGVANDMESIARVVKGEFNKLLLVDGVSSVASLPLHTDAWGLDVVALGSQKGLMLPPGLAFVSFSKQAWEAQAVAKMPRYYFDLAQYQSYLERGQPPFTPSISVMFALGVALDKLLGEGMESILTRHAEVARLTREGIKRLGLSIFPDEKVASNSLTAVMAPEGVDVKKLLEILLREYEIELAGGQGPLTGKIFRIGHMGYTKEQDIQAVLDALKVVLPRVGFAGASAARP